MRSVLSALEGGFLSLDDRSRKLLAQTTDELLFTRPRQLENSMAMFSSGEYLIRSAAIVEKTFGGITTRLWDDPFEWTLPEKLADRSAILKYLDEVDMTRQKGFSFFTSDDDLGREIPAPDRRRSLAEILIDTIALASHFQGRAFAVFQMLSDEKLPRF